MSFMMRKRPPMQPVVWDGKGVIRFQKNHVVDFMLAKLAEKSFDLNDLVRAVNAQKMPPADYDQFLQLIGYSVSGCPYVLPSTAIKAHARSEALIAKHPTDPSTPLASDNRGGDRG
jgi:hypothetical protein